MGTLEGFSCARKHHFFAMQVALACFDSMLYSIGIGFAVFFFQVRSYGGYGTTLRTAAIYLDSDQEGYVASSFDKEAIGKVGVVDSDLKPGGHIINRGQKTSCHLAKRICRAGQKVKVLGGQGESLTVKQQERGNFMNQYSFSYAI